MPNRFVFFDLGGTLLVMRRDRIFRQVVGEEGFKATVSRIHSAYSEAESIWLRRHGYRKLSPERSMESYRRLDAMVFKLVFPDSQPESAAKVSRQIRRRWSELEGRFPPRLYPDAEPTLDLLKKRGFGLGLISNAPPDTLGVVSQLGLTRYMSVVIISGLVGLSKPNPEIFRLGMRLARVKPPGVVHIGDVYEADIAGAKMAGIEGILVDRSGSGPEYHCPIVRSLSEVPALLSAHS